MTGFLARPVGSLMVAVLISGCALPRHTVRPPPPTSATVWVSTLAQAIIEVRAGRYASADTLLLTFQQRHPDTPEAPEAMFYRALFLLDPLNPAVSAHDAGLMLDSVLSERIVSPHRDDAFVLRRVASTMEAKADLVASAGTPTTAVPAHADDSKTRDEEIVRLKEELAKANAELERIRRRLATPRP